MGVRPRFKVYRLAEKLLRIREQLGLSQNEILGRLVAGDDELTRHLSRNSISSYELGRREPPLPIVLRYARIAGISSDILIDDELDLPDPLPGAPAPR